MAGAAVEESCDSGDGGAGQVKEGISFGIRDDG